MLHKLFTTPNLDAPLMRFLAETARHKKHGLANEVFHHPISGPATQERSPTTLATHNQVVHSPQLAKRILYRLRALHHQHTSKYNNASGLQSRRVRSRSAMSSFDSKTPSQIPSDSQCMLRPRTNILLYSALLRCSITCLAARRCSHI